MCDCRVILKGGTRWSFTDSSHLLVIVISDNLVADAGWIPQEERPNRYSDRLSVFSWPQAYDEFVWSTIQFRSRSDGLKTHPWS